MDETDEKNNANSSFTFEWNEGIPKPLDQYKCGGKAFSIVAKKNKNIVGSTIICIEDRKINSEFFKFEALREIGFYGEYTFF